MRQFNAPPGWPDPPNARWRPPKRWGPAESWPPAPAGWSFWVDEDGKPVRGPFGRYGGPSVLKLGAVAAVLLALIGLVLLNPFRGNDVASGVPPRPDSTATSGTEIPPDSTPTAESSGLPTTTPTGEPTDTPTDGPTSTPDTGSSQSPTPSTVSPSTPKPSTGPTSGPTTSGIVYANCAEVRAAGKAPLHRGDPGYSRELDRNGDGIACERGNS